MNKITIIGNLTRDPEHRTTRDGVGLCNFTVAVNMRNGENQTVQYFRVTAWRGLGDICAKYLKKGQKVCVVGPAILNKFTDPEGITRSTMEITAQDVEFLSVRGDRGEAEPSAEEKPASRSGDLITVNMDDDDLPF